MYVKTTLEPSGKTRKRTRRVYHLVCDNCNKDFTRNFNTFNGKRASNNYKHFCNECGRSVIGKYAGAQQIKGPHIGNKYIDDAGYVSVCVGSSHHENSHRGWKREHVLVMENFLGRKLIKGEIVHHIDGNKQNNVITNLDLCNVQEHNFLHANSEKIIFELYKLGIVGYDRNKHLYYLRIRINT